MGIREPAVSKFVLQAAGLIRVILARECRCRRRSRGDECVVSASGNMLIKAARGEPRARSDCFIPREGRERGEREGGGRCGMKLPKKRPSCDRENINHPGEMISTARTRVNA